MSKDEGGRNSSFSEKPVRSRPRRLVDWINLTGAKKVHSLIDKVYKRKNLAMAWEKVKANRGSGGVDGQTLEAFEEQLDQQLDRLQRELRMCQVFCVNDLDFVLGFVVVLGFFVVLGFVVALGFAVVVG